MERMCPLKNEPCVSIVTSWPGPHCRRHRMGIALPPCTGVPSKATLCVRTAYHAAEMGYRGATTCCPGAQPARRTSFASVHRSVCSDTAVDHEHPGQAESRRAPVTGASRRYRATRAMAAPGRILSWRGLSIGDGARTIDAHARRSCSRHDSGNGSAARERQSHRNDYGRDPPPPRPPRPTATPALPFALDAPDCAASFSLDVFTRWARSAVTNPSTRCSTRWAFAWRMASSTWRTKTRGRRGTRRPKVLHTPRL